MKNIIFIILVFFVLSFANCGSQALDDKFTVYNHHYYFHTQLENLKKYGFTEKERFQYGKFDTKTASLTLYDLKSWEAKKTLHLKHYKENVFYVEGYEKIFLLLEKDLELSFIKDKDDVKSYIAGGYGEDLTSLEACKAHAERVRKEIEEAQQCDGCQGPM
ncbi:MAG: hypothetical protein O9301_14845 [Leptospira sp.]|nr:hypothetical protein [Leptospira sp.]